jgi:hypothetical protein
VMWLLSRMFWFQKDFQVKSSAPVEPTVRRCNDASKLRRGRERSTASRQAECDRVNRW